MIAAPLSPDRILWRQSTLGAYLRCPRRVYLEHVLGWPLDHASTGFAAPKGTAMHAAAELCLHAANAGGPPPSREKLRQVLLSAFDDAVSESGGRGETPNDERIDAAMDELEGPELDKIERFAQDERLRAVEWIGTEVPFELRDRYGRRCSGTIDAVGIVRRRYFDFGRCGREPSHVERGEVLVVDHKSGEHPTREPERAGCVQLHYYTSVGLPHCGLKLPRNARVRTFISALRDAASPKRPKDAEGNVIPSKLERLNPEFVEALGRHVRIEAVGPRKVAVINVLARELNLELTEAKAIADAAPTTLTAMDHKDAGKLAAALRKEGAELTLTPWSTAEAEASRRGPKGKDGKRITKRITEDNPAYLEACSKPKGPIFRECVIDPKLAGGAVRAAIRGAEAGLFPASGALNGSCGWCPFRTRCAYAEHS